MTLTMYHPAIMMLLDLLTGNMALVDAPAGAAPDPASLVDNLLTQDGSYLLTQDGSYLLTQG